MDDRNRDVRAFLDKTLAEARQLKARLENLNPDQKLRLARSLKDRAGELASIRDRIEAASAVLRQWSGRDRTIELVIDESRLYADLSSLPYREGLDLMERWREGTLLPPEALRLAGTGGPLDSRRALGHAEERLAGFPHASKAMAELREAVAEGNAEATLQKAAPVALAVAETVLGMTEGCRPEMGEAVFLAALQESMRRFALEVGQNPFVFLHGHADAGADDASATKAVIALWWASTLLPA